MSQEHTPLLTQSKNPSAFPPYLGGKQAPPPYGVIEVRHYIPTEDYNHYNTKPRQPNGFPSTTVVALIALGIAMVLIFFSATLITPDEQRAINGVLMQSAPNNLLKQSASDDGKISPSPAPYKDITIPQGRLRGFTKKSRQGRDYTAYYKVPYAEPPLGELRFKDPIPPTPWEGIRSISEVATQCIQKEKYSKIDEAVGVEDCLHANIYVPTATSEEQETSLPVMVYIHGGGYTDGNGSRYGPNYFMDEDVILITFEFRLGAFGFLNTNDDVIHGNMGMKDQVQMLKWTRDNVQYFGGDPNRVTIFGNSGGGISVSFLVLSPMANGLFHRAISQSGASVCASAGPGQNMVDVNPSRTVNEVGRVLNCDTLDSTKFLECLRTKDAVDIALVRTPEALYSLTLENRTDNQVFMSDTPSNMLKKGPNKVPYIIGVVNAEWTGQGINLIMDKDKAKDLNEDFGGKGNEILELNLTPEELLSIKRFYFGDKEIGNSTFREAINMMSDKGMIHCSYASAKMHAENNNPTYLYVLNKPPAKSYAEKGLPGFPAKELGLVSHADELQYQFLYYGYPEILNGDPEYFDFSRYFVKQWATFAANGAPSSDWQPIVAGESSNSTFWFDLNDNPGRTEAMRDRMNFWDQFTHKQLGYE